MLPGGSPFRDNRLSLYCPEVETLAPLRADINFDQVALGPKRKAGVFGPSHCLRRRASALPRCRGCGPLQRRETASSEREPPPHPRRCAAGPTPVGQRRHLSGATRRLAKALPPRRLTRPAHLQGPFLGSDCARGQGGEDRSAPVLAFSTQCPSVRVTTDRHKRGPKRKSLPGLSRTSYLTR